MKHIKSYRLFESRFVELKEVVSTIKDICQEFEDNNCFCKVFPQGDIKLKIVSIKKSSYWDYNTFYLEIDINRRIISTDENRTGLGSLPEWFIETCRRLEDYMLSEGFETKPSVRYGTDWENFETIDELSEVIGLIYKVKLEFISNEIPKEI
jgi:hypothetical protein